MEEKNIIELMHRSIEDQTEREKRLHNHTNTYLTASSIALLAETTLFAHFSDWYLNASNVLWMLSLLLLILQFVAIAISYIILISGKRANLASPNALFEWYQQCLKELKGKDEDEKSMEYIKAMKVLAENKHSLLQADVNKSYKKFRIICFVSFSMVALFALFTVICCFYSCAVYPDWIR